MPVPVKKRKHSTDGAVETRPETLRTLVKRLYNTARTNLFNLVILKFFRTEIGARPITRYPPSRPTTSPSFAPRLAVCYV